MAELGEHIERNPNVGYEQSDWPLGIISLTLLGILVFLAVVPIVMIGAFSKAVPDVSRALTVEPPEPRLQTDPPQDLVQFRTREDERLNGYYWVDKDKGIVHIPIEQAMKAVAEEGIGGFPRGRP